MNEEQGCVALVVDTGSSTVKVGFAGDDAPVAILEAKGVQKDLIVDFEEIGKIWSNGIAQTLETEGDIDTYSVLLSESPLNTFDLRAKTLEYFFENQSVSSAYIKASPVLSMYSYGKLAGLVVEMGDANVFVSSIHENNILPNSLKYVNACYTGTDLTKYLQDLLKERDINGLTDAISKDIKEKYLNISVDGNTKIDTTKTYTLPDGSSIEIPEEECLRTGELIFNPPSPTIGLADLIDQSINSVSENLRQSLLRSTLLGGGGSLIPGLKERIKEELKKLNHNYVTVLGTPNRRFSVWNGGSALASNEDVFNNLVISRKEYEEEGANVIKRKI